MKEQKVSVSIRINKSTKKKLETEAQMHGLSVSEYERMKLESSLKPREMKKRERCVETVRKIEIQNQVRDYMKTHKCDDELDLLFRSILLN